MRMVAPSNANRNSTTAPFSALFFLSLSRMNKPRILLIEDDRREASSLERLLQTEAYAVTVEHRGDDGLRRAQAEDFDVVITDLRMPGLDGLEIIRQMHAARPARARNWSLAPFTSTATAPTNRSSPSIARPFRKRSSKANCSGTRRARLPARRAGGLAVLNRRTGERFFSMKSAT